MIFPWYLDKGNLQNLPWHLFVMFFATLFGAYCRDMLFRDLLCVFTCRNSPYICLRFIF